MTTLPFTLAIEPTPTQFLLTVRGSLAADTREAGRLAHNQVAGSDEGVAMARSFGDLSHAVFVPVDEPSAGAGELLIIDYWNSVDGLMQFFSNEQVQSGGKFVFKADRDNVVWANTPGLPNVSLAAPTGLNERYVGLVRGPVASRDGAEKLLTEATRKALNGNRAKGLMSRQWYFRADQPGKDAGGDRRRCLVRRQGHAGSLRRPAEMAPLANLFTARPATSVWKKPAGQWVEW